MFKNLYRVLKINERGGVKMLWTPLKGFIDKKYKEFREDYENKYFRRILKNENEYKYEKINIKCNIISNGVSATSNNTTDIYN